MIIYIYIYIYNNNNDDNNNKNPLKLSKYDFPPNYMINLWFPFEMKTDHNMVKDIIPLKKIIKFDYNSIQKKKKVNTVNGSIKVIDSEKLQALLTTALLTGNTNFESLMPTIDASFANKEKHEPKSKVQKFTLSYIENKDSVTIQKIQLIN